MPSLNQQETAALQEVDTQTFRLPNGKNTEITTTWHTWLAYEELQAFYGWGEEEIFTLWVQQCEEGESDPSLAFENVVAHAYAGCRQEDEELHEADSELPLLPSSYQSRNTATRKA